VPDRIAWTRVVLVPVVLVLVLSDSYVAAAMVFAVAAITDFLDGYLARRWSQTTILGGFLDTIADKLLVTGTLFALVEVGRAWAWAAFVIVGREIAIMGLRGIVALDGSKVPPSMLGKVKATVQFFAMFLAILRTSGEWGRLYPDEWAMLVAVVITIASGVDYLARSARVIRSLASQ
jgi:CDP-diacylglycerol--glycerol-3-phosphate 3-phosphatidyltransferase